MLVTYIKNVDFSCNWTHQPHKKWQSFTWLVSSRQFLSIANGTQFIFSLSHFSNVDRQFLQQTWVLGRPCFVLVANWHAKVSTVCSDKLFAIRNLLFVLLGTYAKSST